MLVCAFHFRQKPLAKMLFLLPGRNLEDSMPKRIVKWLGITLGENLGIGRQITTGGGDLGIENIPELETGHIWRHG